VNWRAQWNRLSRRERALIAAAAAVLGLALLRFLVVSPFLNYRESLRDEITVHRDMLENARAYLTRAGEVTKRHAALRARYQEIRAQLVPGETPTLAAASLQDMLHSLATEKGINIQSAQVMREETVGSFRRIAVRITVTGELRPIAEFLAGVEYSPRRVAISYLEISRRGAVLRGQSARALAATVEVNAFLQGPDDQVAPEHERPTDAAQAAEAAADGAGTPLGLAATPAGPTEATPSFLEGAAL
jgi:Tfp pilus assembly protein PilO